MKIISITSTTLMFILLISSFYINYYNHNIFTENYNEEQTQIYEDLREFLDQDYFGYERTYLLDPFEENEKDHYIDVKRIIDWVRISFYSLFGILAFLIFYIQRNRLEIADKIFLHTGIKTLVLIGIIGLISTINFELFWELFHEILFPQGNWQFAPDSLTIILFPIELFNDFVRRFVGLVVAFSATLILISIKKRK